ncbi:MAG: GNAT family N-acetyltransferase [Anaerolineae bacterium]|nr:GNAT family N-acetyltransferase [Anaerolineae bacterium]
MDPRYTIRPGAARDLDALPLIELAAAQLFSDHGWEGEPILDDAISVEGHRMYLNAGRLWVVVDADDQPVGFAALSEVDGHAHLDEIDVHPDHGRCGIGRALVAHVCAWAQEAGYPAISLTTERDIPWNAPFYATLDFAILAPDDLTDGLRTILAGEAEWARDPATRVAMVRPLADEG